MFNWIKRFFAVETKPAVPKYESAVVEEVKPAPAVEEPKTKEIKKTRKPRAPKMPKATTAVKKPRAPRKPKYG
jgi:hypothetical protein